MRIIFADTETTSASADAGVCELGWIETDLDFNEVSRVQSLIDPQKPISPSASGIHGIVNADVADSPTLEEFFTTQHDMCWGSLLEGDVIIIGHNIKFDLQFLRPYIPTLAGEVCTYRWSRKLFPDAPDHKLSTMKYLLELPRNNGASHRVMTDVEDALSLCKHICEVQDVTLPELVELSRQPMLIEYMTFGKHKGVRMSEVPLSYLQWMRREMDMDVDMKYTVDFYLKKP